MTTQSNKDETVNRLEEFIKKAEKLGKYPINTAGALLSALNIVAEGLTDDEPSDLEYIVEHVEDIFHRQAHKLNLSDRSMQTYMSRVRKIIRDFKTYGQDSKAMHAWKPKRMSRNRTAPATGQPEDRENFASSFAGPLTEPLSAFCNGAKATNLRTLTWPLRQDIVIQIQLPADLNQNDVTNLKGLLDLLVKQTPNKQSQ